MANGVDTPVHLVQAALEKAMVNGPSAEFESQELPTSNDPMLPCGYRGQGPLTWGVFTMYSMVKRAHVPNIAGPTAQVTTRT
jgi:hypothetical protein